jgi:hypothetical protein
MSELPSNGPDTPRSGEYENVIPFPDREQLDPQAEQIQEALLRLATGDPVEEFFYTPGGNSGMRRLIRTMNDSHDLVRATQNILSQHRSKWEDTEKLLLSRYGTEGLRHPTLARPFMENQAMYVTHQMVQRAEYAGMKDMAQTYKTLNVLLANITRFQLTKGTYDPESEQWLLWSSKIPYHTGDPNKIEYYHPHRLKRPRHPK